MHLQRLIASWHILSDFCFSDLLLFVPIDDTAEDFVIIGQVRPSTSQTLYRTDMIGKEVDDEERPLVSRSFHLGEIIDGEHLVEPLREPVRVVCIPVRHDGVVIAVLSRLAPKMSSTRAGISRTIAVQPATAAPECRCFC